MEAAAKILELRQLLAARFPQPKIKAGTRIPTGIAQLDEPLDGGLCKGTITELVSATPSCGSALVISAILSSMVMARQFMALVDGSDSFDPQPIENDTL